MRVIIETYYDDQKNIIGELVIESDNMDFTVKTIKKSAKNKAGFNQEIHGHYPSLASAAKSIIRLKIMESTAQTLRELIQDIARIEAWIHELIQF